MALDLEHALRHGPTPCSEPYQVARTPTPAPDRPSLTPSPGQVKAALETVLEFISQQQDEACLSDEDDAITIQNLMMKVQAHDA